MSETAVVIENLKQLIMALEKHDAVVDTYRCMISLSNTNIINGESIHVPKQDGRLTAYIFMEYYLDE